MKTKSKNKILMLITVICITAILASLGSFFAYADVYDGPEPSEEIVVGNWGFVVYPEGVEPRVCVISYYGEETSLVIPAKIGEYKVDCFGDYWGGATGGRFRSYKKNEASANTVTEIVISDGIRYVSKQVCTDRGGGKYAFTSLKSVTIPKSVKDIGWDAFKGCINLKNIKIPNSVMTIGSNAFYDTGDYNTAANWENGILYIDNCLVDADSEKIPNNIIIRQGTRIIAESAFYYCKNLNSIVIPDGVISICDGAFYMNESLTEFNIPESVIYIGNYAFYGTAFSKNENNLVNGALYADRCLIGIETISSGKLEVVDGTRLIYANYYEKYYTIIVPKSVTIINGLSRYAAKIYGYKNTVAEEYVENHPVCNFENSDGYWRNAGRIFISLDDNTAYLYNSDVSVSGKESSFPSNVLLTVKKEESVKDTKVVFDITLTVDGETTQPNGEVTVKIPVPEAMDSKSVKVYREEADGTLTDMKAVYENGYMVFTTEHFSKYILEGVPAEIPDNPQNPDNLQNPEKPQNPNNPQIPNTEENTTVYSVISVLGVMMIFAVVAVSVYKLRKKQFAEN